VVAIRAIEGDEMSLILWLIPLVGAIPQGDFTSDRMPADYWRNPRRCGPNCVYAYLRLHGHDIPLSAVVERVPLTDRGSSLADLRAAATDLGVSSRVLRTIPSRLVEIDLPAIAHMQTREGHFVIILKVDPEVIVVSDMLRGDVERMPPDVFYEQWSGFVLVPSGGALSWRAQALIAVGFAALLGAAAYRPREKPAE
jgi:hypothetical protein